MPLGGQIKNITNDKIMAILVYCVTFINQLSYILMVRMNRHTLGLKESPRCGEPFG